MRDLAKQDFGQKRKPNLKNFVLPGAILFFILVILFAVKSALSGSSNSGGSLVLHEAPPGLKPVQTDGTSQIKGGVDLTTQTASFKDVKYGGDAQAKATRSFGGGLYILSVDATLPDPKNTYYEVWLVGGGKVVPVDFMTGSKNTWSLRLRGDDKFSSYRGIWITLERTKDTLPEEHVLEGSF